MVSQMGARLQEMLERQLAVTIQDPTDKKLWRRLTWFLEVFELTIADSQDVASAFL